MNVAVAGTFRIPPEKLEAMKPVVARLIAATRGEDGCIVYSIAVDIEDPGLIRVFEIWRDQAALDAHYAAPHMKTWRAVATAADTGFGIHERMIKHYDIGEARSV